MRFVVLVLLAAMCGGCATVTRGTTSQVQIESEPAGAEARTSLGHACTTPCTISVNRKDEFTVTFVKPGYQPVTVPVTTKIANAGVAGFAGNVLIGGVIGMGVDAATGSTLEHTPNPVAVTLQPFAPRSPPPPAVRRKPEAIPPRRDGPPQS